MNIEEAIDFGKQELKKENIEDEVLKTRLLLCNILNKGKEYLIINSKLALTQNQETSFLEGIKKLKNGYPIQYITNKQFFRDCEFYVNENVLIPQPDTEILVEECLKLAENMNIPNILDLCTGSGAIAISIAKKVKANIFATDISKQAIEIAEKNAKLNNVNVKFILGDLFENIENKNFFDIIVSNPPYIETNTIKQLSREVQNEPILALDGGEDGLNFYKKIAKEAKIYLNKEGYLALEIGYNQKEKVCKILDNRKYECENNKKEIKKKKKQKSNKIYKYRKSTKI